MITDADREELQKSAATLRRKFAAAEKRADDGGLMGMWSGMSDSQKKIVRDALIGLALGGVGGAAGGAAAAGPDESRLAAALRFGLMGAGTGAAVGGGGRAAVESLTGGLRLPGEAKGRSGIPVPDRALDAATRGLLSNVGAVVGGGTAGLAGWKGLKLDAEQIQRWMAAGKHEKVLQLLRQAAAQKQPQLVIPLPAAEARLGGITGGQGPLAAIRRGQLRRQLLREALSRPPSYLDVGGRLGLLALPVLGGGLLGHGIQRYIQGKDI